MDDLLLLHDARLKDLILIDDPTFGAVNQSIVAWWQMAD
jgi:hypothetical protein